MLTDLSSCILRKLGMVARWYVSSPTLPPTSSAKFEIGVLDPSGPTNTHP